MQINKCCCVIKLIAPTKKFLLVILSIHLYYCWDFITEVFVIFSLSLNEVRLVIKKNISFRSKNSKFDDKTIEMSAISTIIPIRKITTDTNHDSAGTGWKISYRSGPVRPVEIICSTGEIPVKPVKNRRKNEEFVFEKQF